MNLADAGGEDSVGPIETYPQHGSIRGLVGPNSRALDQQQKNRIPDRP
jgi:hypothetical protein